MPDEVKAEARLLYPEIDKVDLKSLDLYYENFYFNKRLYEISPNGFITILGTITPNMKKIVKGEMQLPLEDAEIRFQKIINEAKLNNKNVAFVSSNNSNEIKKLMLVKPDGHVQEIEYKISSLAQHDLLLIHSEEINVLSGKLSTALAMTTAVVQQQTEQAKTLTKHTGIIPANIPPIKLSVLATSLYRKFTQDQLDVLLNADMISQEHYSLLQITD